MKNFILFLSLFVSLSCICGMCNKDDDTPADNGDDTDVDGYVEPDLKPEAIWLYMTSSSLPFFYGPDNKRPLWRRWMATKISVGNAFELSNSHEYFDVHFENSDKYTRFLSDKLNPGGKEVLSIALVNFTKSPPEPGTFYMDIDNKQGYCWYYVYDANGNQIDSTRTPSFETSAFTVTKFIFVNSFDDDKFSTYRMSGTADLKIMYWKSGTSSTTDVQDLQLTFNNMLVTFSN